MAVADLRAELGCADQGRDQVKRDSEVGSRACSQRASMVNPSMATGTRG
jgi:hypothetical protein